MTTRITRLAGGLASAAALVAALAFWIAPAHETGFGVALKGPHKRQWQLPHSLTEASGLAILDADHLITHNDESGHIYRVAILDKTIETFAVIGTPAVDADFEGIAYHAGRTYLSTSLGHIYVVEDLAPDELNQQAPVVVIDTGLADICETEGLHAVDGMLLLPCKINFETSYAEKLVVFGYDLATGQVSELLNLSYATHYPVDGFNPTAMDATDSDFYFLSGNNLVLIDRLSLQARFFGLSKSLHYQPEGLAVLNDGSFVIVDDHRHERGKLTHYENLGELTELTGTPDPMFAAE